MAPVEREGGGEKRGWGGKGEKGEGEEGGGDNDINGNGNGNNNNNNSMLNSRTSPWFILHNPFPIVVVRSPQKYLRIHPLISCHCGGNQLAEGGSFTEGVTLEDISVCFFKYARTANKVLIIRSKKKEKEIGEAQHADEGMSQAQQKKKSWWTKQSKTIGIVVCTQGQKHEGTNRDSKQTTKKHNEKWQRWRAQEKHRQTRQYYDKHNDNQCNNKQQQTTTNNNNNNNNNDKQWQQTTNNNKQRQRT